MFGNIVCIKKKHLKDCFFFVVFFAGFFWVFLLQFFSPSLTKKKLTFKNKITTIWTNKVIDLQPKLKNWHTKKIAK
jgi:hypothetical protein